MNVTDRVKVYLRLVAMWYVEDRHNAAAAAAARDAIWVTMTKEERDLVNEIMDLVFGEYL